MANRTDVEALRHAARLVERQYDFETAEQLRKIARDIERMHLSNKAEV